MNFLQTTARRTAGLIGRESGLIRRLRPAYENFLDWTGGPKGVPWNINGVTFRVDPHYRHRLGQNYDAPVAEFLRTRVKPGDLCIDVGANVGVYVLQFAHWSGPTGRVVAFEPNPGACAVLQKHVELNNLSARVEIIPAAVGAQRGNATLFAAEADGMSRLGAPNELIADRVKEITVTLMTLDNACAEWQLQPDWVFIDIEGFEIEALAGARKIMSERGPALNIIVEMHPSVWASANTTRMGAEMLLDELRLTPVPLTGQSDPLGEHGLVYLEHQARRG
jgi:FkbM family methyltransferase